ncbi:MAG: DNA replication/repair protein RecF [Alphaproteobacteria bacterium]|nr:DNA replication/repair protein RecF [Alphaproteobacteria bacterium]
MILTLDRTRNDQIETLDGMIRSPAISRLILTDFRSYAALRVETDARPVVLTGANGAGKTNLLEAVSLLAPGRGLRRARNTDLDRRDGGAWSVAARVEIDGHSSEIGTGRARDGGRERRIVRINGQSASNQAALGEFVSVLWLTPSMDRLFQEGSSERRRFLDRLVLANDSAHVGRVSSYSQALKERGRLLRAGRTDPAWLDALESRAAASAVAIAAARRQTVKALSDALTTDPGHFPRPIIGLDGAVEDWLSSLSALDCEQRLAARFQGDREQDAETGTTATGPHRSDLVVHDAGSGVPAGEGSTGQQKALLISICLAEARRRASLGQRLPILLLDEVAAHLDSERRRDLFDELAGLGTQAWLTGTDASMFQPFGQRAQYFSVNSSELHPYDVN